MVVVWIACVVVGAILVVLGVIERSPVICSTGLLFEPGNIFWIFSSSYILSLVFNYSFHFSYCPASVCFVLH